MSHDFQWWAQVFNTPKTSVQVLPNIYPFINSVPRAALPPDLKRPLCEAITFFTLVSRLRMHGACLQFFTCFHVIKVVKFTFTYVMIYLFIIFNCFIICSFQIADILYENQASVRFLRNVDTKSGVHNMYFDSTKF